MDHFPRQKERRVLRGHEWTCAFQSSSNLNIEPDLLFWAWGLLFKASFSWRSRSGSKCSPPSLVFSFWWCFMWYGERKSLAFTLTLAQCAQFLLTTFYQTVFFLKLLERKLARRVTMDSTFMTLILGGWNNTVLSSFPFCCLKSNFFYFEPLK